MRGERGKLERIHNLEEGHHDVGVVGDLHEVVVDPLLNNHPQQVLWNQSFRVPIRISAFIKEGHESRRRRRRMGEEEDEKDEMRL